MFSTYKQVIRETYLHQKATGALSLRLQQPTPSGIKEELIQHLNERFEPLKDEKALELFFGRRDGAEAYAREVNGTDIDKFRPVIQFLKGLRANPDDRQVHLAALLIDFERPYVFGKEYIFKAEGNHLEEGDKKIGEKEHHHAPEDDAPPVPENDVETTDDPLEDETENAGQMGEGEKATEADSATVPHEPIVKVPRLSGEEIQNTNEEKNTNGPEAIAGDVEVTGRDSDEMPSGEVEEHREPNGEELESDGESERREAGGGFRKRIFKKKRELILLGILLLGSSGFVVHRLTSDITGTQCMYWKEDHYEAIACNIPLVGNMEKIALDTFLLNNFKKITREDTITERSIGKIWYLKHQKAFDYFTADGKHPIHKRKLSRLSQYIYNNEIRPQKTRMSVSNAAVSSKIADFKERSTEKINGFWSKWKIWDFWLAISVASCIGIILPQFYRE